MRVRRGGDSGIADPGASVNLPLERSSGRNYSENLDFAPRATDWCKDGTPDQWVTCKFVLGEINDRPDVVTDRRNGLVGAAPANRCWPSMCVLHGGFFAPPRPPVYRRDEMALTEKRQPTLRDR